MKTYVRNSLLYDSKHLEKRKKMLRDEFQVHKYAERVRLLSTIGYKNRVLFEAIQNRDVDKIFEIMHQRLMQTSALYRIKNRLGVSWK